MPRCCGSEMVIRERQAIFDCSVCGRELWQQDRLKFRGTRPKDKMYCERCVYGRGNHDAECPVGKEEDLFRIKVELAEIGRLWKRFR
jgi:hypothetical protein